MRKVVLFVHTSLDGYVAGLNGELDWIDVGESLWDFITEITDAADTALFGAKTFKIMEDYWPTAAEQPDANRHEIDHAHWVNSVPKFVVSKSLEKTDWQGTRIIRDNVKDAIEMLKAQPGKNILILGSPSLAKSLLELGLIDEINITVNPIILGKGKKLFEDIQQPVHLSMQSTQTFQSGVVAITYAME